MGTKYDTLAEAEAVAERLHESQQQLSWWGVVSVKGFRNGVERPRAECITAEDRGEPVEWVVYMNETEL